MIDARKARRNISPLLLVFFSFLIGAGLRIIWLSDMEFKGDEHYMFGAGVDHTPTQAFPSLGMNSGASARNPGLSIWVYSLPAKLFHLSSPEGFAVIPILSLLFSVMLLILFIRREIPPEEEAPWLYACALILINPLLYLYSRKIWAQCLLPFFSVLFLWAWWRRKEIGPALAWGLLSSLLGQVHMSGFFFVPAFILWSLVRDRKNVCWWAFAIGLFLGAIPALPWLDYLWTMHQDPQATTMLRLGRPFQFTFFLHWLVLPTGLGLHENLGGDFRTFLRFPIIRGIPTYFCLLVHLGILGLALSFYLPWLREIFQKVRYHFQRRTFGWPTEPTGVYIFLSSIVFGLIITYSGLRIPRHYLLSAYPIIWIWFCRLALRQRYGSLRLTALWFSQLLVTVLVILFIHFHGGAPQGDYGLPLRLQRHSQVFEK